MNGRALTLVNEARKLIGVRFRHGGRGQHSLDCAGIVVTPLTAMGVQVRDVKGYSMGVWGSHLSELLEREFGAPVQDRLAGDVILVRWVNTAHLGILGDHPDGGLTVIHVSNIHGVIEQRYAGPIRACTVAVFRPFGEEV